jgi:hypothetical protein
MAKKGERMLTIREVAEITGASASSIRVWLSNEEERTRRFPGARKESSPIGDFWLIPESALVGFEMGKPGRPRKKGVSKKRKG